MRYVKVVLLCVLTALCGFTLTAQERGELLIKGVVYDHWGETVAGANIYSKNKASVGTSTDLDGKFQISVSQGDVIVISFLGYENIEYPVTKAEDNLIFTLRENSQLLDDVVIVGYGVQKKKLFTGATIQVKGEDIAKLSTVNVLGALQNQTPGVNIIKNNGKPGEGFKVIVRGIGTVGDYAPLYVIDGMIGGDINLLNPSEIESIDVLKDAASAAIYGSRAANGVILVTTKRGKGKATISLDAFYGWQNMYKKAQPLDALQYATIMNEGRLNDGLAPWNYSQELGGDVWNSIESGRWKGTNWLNEMETPNAPIQNYALNVTGGTDQGNYAIGLGYTSQDGIIGGNYIDSKYERYNGHINSDYTIFKNDRFDIIKIGESLSFNMVNRNGLGVATDGPYWNDLRNALTMYPFMPVYDKDGEFSKEMAWGTPEVNPIGNLFYNRSYNKGASYGLRSNFYASIQPIEKLVFRTSFGFGASASTSRSFTPSYNLGQDYIVIPGLDRTNQSSGAGYSWVWDNTLNYDFKLGNAHSIGVMAGMSAEKWGIGEGLEGSNVNSEFGSWKNAFLSNNKTIIGDRTTLSGYPWGNGGILSYFGRVTYDYKGTYMATVNIRTDASSNFARGHRWSKFPSVSAGWVMTNESFMESAKDWLSFLKPRISWGQNGNMNIDSFQYLATIAIGGNEADYFFGNDKLGKTTGAYPDIVPNPLVSWETSEQLDLGFDAYFFKNRLGFVFDYYNKITKNWLVRAPTLATDGTGAPYINGGDIRNRGYEISTSWKDNIGDFSYGASFNISYNDNEVTRLANAEGILNGPGDILSSQTGEFYRAQVGYPIGYFYGYKTDGIFQNEAEVKAYTGSKGLILPEAKPGDVRFVDLNGNGEIDAADRTMIGNPNPDFITGLSLNAAWKGFDIAISGNGTFGNQIAKSYRSFADHTYHNYTMDIIKDRWHGEGTSNKIPRITSSPHINWTYLSDIYIENGDYFRISNLSFGYDFKQLFKKLPFKQLHVYATVQNLYTFTDYSGMDPEIGRGEGRSWASGIDLGYYPGARTFILGTNIVF